VGGTLNVFLDETGSTWAGTAYYESVDLEGARFRATYKIDGALEEGALHLDESDLVEADDLPDGYGWCLGSYDFAVDPGQTKPELSGAYTSKSCGCTGATAMRPLELL
jgi:hypothetical protein